MAVKYINIIQSEALIFFQIGIFGLKINHLATLVAKPVKPAQRKTLFSLFPSFVNVVQEFLWARQNKSSLRPFAGFKQT
jgi:hypothetical protein